MMPEPRPADLYGAWVHSHEEDTPGEWVFRPATFAFPPSRGRRAFTLAADGSYQDRVPGPDDRGVAGGGTWELTTAGELVLRGGGAGGGSRAHRVVSAGRERLVLKKP
jgi:hypothetical protein